MSDTGEEWQVARRRKGAARRVKTVPVSGNAACSQDQLDIGKTVKRIKETVAELRCEDIWKEWKGESLGKHISHYTFASAVKCIGCSSVTLAATLSPEHLLISGSSSFSTLPLNKETEVSSVWLQESTDDRIHPQFEFVCYGLGAFSSSVSARYQLAMMLLLLEALQIPLKDCSVFDPAFSSGENDVLRELGLTVLTENEEGKRLVSKPTLFYLMHCGKALYNNLLWKNWSPQCLPLMKIIGNSFNSIRERMIEREFKQDYSYISQVVAVSEERQLACPSRLLDVFGDTAVITFPSSSLVKLPESTWAEPPEPQYQHCPDLEIILRGAQS